MKGKQDDFKFNFFFGNIDFGSLEIEINLNKLYFKHIKNIVIL